MSERRWSPLILDPNAQGQFKALENFWVVSVSDRPFAVDFMENPLTQVLFKLLHQLATDPKDKKIGKFCDNL